MSGRRRRGKVGIALAGGGPLGGIYEIGALLALEEALKGVTLTKCDVYVGVSSGAFVAAGLANGISPREMHAMFILDRSHRDPFEPDLLLRPAFGEFARRLMRMPELMQAAAFAYFGTTPARGLFESFMRLTRGLPNGLFDNNAIASYLSRLFSQPGRTDDFRKLGRQALHRRHRTRQRQVGAVRLARPRPRADFRGGQGERGSAGPLSAGADRRSRLCRRRDEEDAARFGGAEGRREAAHLHQSARAL